MSDIADSDKNIVAYILSLDSEEEQEVIKQEKPKPLLSKVFGEAVPDRAKLEIHQCSHKADKPFSCGVCDKKFTKKCALFRHTTRVHGGEHFCPSCKKSFKSKSALSCHMRVHTKENTFACKTCGKKFSKSYHLEGHEKTHTTDAQFHCKTCPRTFATKQGLAGHQRTHVPKNEQYMCNTCNKFLACKRNLTRHERIHF